MISLIHLLYERSLSKFLYLFYKNNINIDQDRSISRYLFQASYFCQLNVFIFCISLSIKGYEIKFISDLQHVSDLLMILCLHAPIKWTKILMEFRTDGVRSGETNTNVHFEFSKMEISWSDIDRDPPFLVQHLFM